MRSRVTDASMIVLVLATTTVFAIFAVNWDIPPFEDAAMLMRYAEHLAQGNGFVWNTGEAPVDGGTDFLFIVCVAALRWVGLSLESATRLLAISAHVMTVVTIYVGMRRVQGSGILSAFVSALYFSLGPGLFLAAAYFGTPFYAFAVAVAWLLAQRLMFASIQRTRDIFVFAFSCLVCGLIRPEGVLIGIFMLIAVGIVATPKDFGRPAIIFGAVFVVFGGVYFAWHWMYFGYPLPNPLYVKGSEHFYPVALRESVRNTASLLLPISLAFLLSMRSRTTFRLGIAFAVPIAGSTVIWLFLSNEMNFGGRFQYPVLAIGVLSWYPLVKSLREDLPRRVLSWPSWQAKFAAASIAGVLVVCAFALHVHHSLSVTYARDGKYDLGVMLKRYADSRYTIATTEAGLLPLYSQWRAIDTWGLNDKWIAHHGGITREYLEQQRPDIIAFHDVENSPLGPRWSRQIEVLREYTIDNHFAVAASFGTSADNTFRYYVRSDLPERAEIVRGINSVEYGLPQMALPGNK